MDGVAEAGEEDVLRAEAGRSAGPPVFGAGVEKEERHEPKQDQVIYQVRNFC